MRGARLATPWAAVIAITACFAVVAWSGVEQFRASGGDDEVAFQSYASELYANHRLPAPSENDEYSLPPGVPALGVAVTWAFKPIVPSRPSPFLQSLSRLLRRLLWIMLAAGGAALLTRAGPARLVGLGLLLAAAGWAWIYVSAAVDNEAWLPLVLVDFVSAVLLVPLTAWLAHEVWPRSRSAPVLGALGAVLLPPIFAASLYFHPDPPFAVLAVAATALALRAVRDGTTTVRAGIAAGVVLGLAALTRQSAISVAVALLIGAALVARRRALGYVAAVAVAMVLVAGAWWVHAADAYGNPFQSNLNRPGYMLGHEPRTFYVSLPIELISHPRYYKMENKLLPRFHATIWSDWSGIYHQLWGPKTKEGAKTLSSVQSVLGLGGDALVLGGLALFGLPPLVRVIRRRAEEADAAPAVLATLFVLAWAAYVAMLIRFPQKGGDPIKAHYLLFLAPVSVVFAIAAGRMLYRRGGWRRALLAAWLAAYTVSWSLTLLTAF